MTKHNTSYSLKTANISCEGAHPRLQIAPENIQTTRPVLMRPTRPTGAGARLSWRRAASWLQNDCFFLNKSQLWWLIIQCNLSSVRGGRGSAVCSPVQWGYSGQTPKRRRGSPLGSEQMSESDWFSALTLNRGSVTVSANQRAGNAFSAVANLCGQWQQTTRCPDTRPGKADAPKVNMNIEKSQRGRINQCKMSTTMFVWFSWN